MAAQSEKSNTDERTSVSGARVVCPTGGSASSARQKRVFQRLHCPGDCGWCLSRATWRASRVYAGGAGSRILVLEGVGRQ